METFQDFGVAERIIAEAYRITATVFWKPGTADHTQIARAARAADDTTGMSEFPHLIVNQARVLDYFAELMAYSPSRMKPDYGWAFRSLAISDSGDCPVAVTLVGTAGGQSGVERVSMQNMWWVLTVRAVLSADRSGRRTAAVTPITPGGAMDVLAVTDFPDIRSKCAIQSGDGGNILLIPREGGSLFRMYVDRGEAVEDGLHSVRNTTVAQITAKAGQGMNVSMQDGFNLGWKIAHVLAGRSPASLLATYSAARKVAAKKLIGFDLQWSALMAMRPEDMGDRAELENFFERTFEFPAGFMPQYQPSMIFSGTEYQELATGFRLASASSRRRLSG